MTGMTAEAPIDVNVRREVDRLLAGNLTLDEFEEWFAGATWDDRTDLVKDVDLVLAERHVLREAEVQQRLADLATDGRIARGIGTPKCLSSGRTATN